jgi:hypothetical protein
VLRSELLPYFFFLPFFLAFFLLLSFFLSFFLAKARSSLGGRLALVRRSYPPERGVYTDRITDSGA